MPGSACKKERTERHGTHDDGISTVIKKELNWECSDVVLLHYWLKAFQKSK
jgi:hypothetical protein